MNVWKILYYYSMAWAYAPAEHYQLSSLQLLWGIMSKELIPFCEIMTRRSDAIRNEHGWKWVLTQAPSQGIECNLHAPCNNSALAKINTLKRQTQRDNIFCSNRLAMHLPQRCDTRLRAFDEEVSIFSIFIPWKAVVCEKNTWDRNLWRPVLIHFDTWLAYIRDFFLISSVRSHGWRQTRKGQTPRLVLKRR